MQYSARELSALYFLITSSNIICFFNHMMFLCAIFREFVSGLLLPNGALD